MNSTIRKTLLFVLGLVMALGSSLSTMEGGASLTFNDLGDIPLMAWLFALGAGISGFLGNPPPKKNFENKH